jgi:hypothetical protein
MRNLLYLPLIHAPEELGEFGDVIKQAFVQTGKEQEWFLYKRRVFEFYVRAWQLLCSLHVDKIYMDSTVKGTESMVLALTRHLAPETGIGLVNRLVEQGSALVGVESADLLRELIRGLQTRDLVGFQAIIAERDLFLEEEINRDLQEGQIGLLLLGALHCPTFPSDIQISPLGLQEAEVRFVEEIVNSMGRRNPALLAHAYRYNKLIM